MTHVNTSKNCPSLHATLPKWLRDPLDLEGKAERAAAKAAKATARAARQQQDAQQQAQLQPPANHPEPPAPCAPPAFGAFNRLGYEGPKAGEPIDISIIDAPPYTPPPQPLPGPRMILIPRCGGGDETRQYIVSFGPLNSANGCDIDVWPYDPADHAASESKKPQSRQVRRRIEKPWKKRAKTFGKGTVKPMSPDDKRAMMARGRELMRPTEPGMHYGAITGKAFRVLETLLYTNHNGRSGVCFPSYETIAKAAGCSTSTVHRSLRMLEEAGLITWDHRIARVRIDGKTRVIRTSNAYRFIVPLKNKGKHAKTSESDLCAGTKNQDKNNLPKEGECNKKFCETTKSSNSETDGAASRPLLT